MLSDRYKLLHMTQQHSCCVLCKISQQSLYDNLEERKMKFLSTCNEKSLVKWTWEEFYVKQYQQYQYVFSLE